MQRVGLLPRQVFDAVKEYGLRLEARQAPIEMMNDMGALQRVSV